jgi:hypothetical protein
MKTVLIGESSGATGKRSWLYTHAIRKSRTNLLPLERFTATGVRRGSSTVPLAWPNGECFHIGGKRSTTIQSALEMTRQPAGRNVFQLVPRYTPGLLP